MVEGTQGDGTARSGTPRLPRVRNSIEETQAFFGQKFLPMVDQAVDTKWEHAKSRAASSSGTTAERVAKTTRVFAVELGALGATTGAASVIPGTGAGTAVAAMAVDLGWYTLRTADLIMTIAAIHGHTAATVEERRAWILSVLAFGDGAGKGFTRVAEEVGKGLGAKATKRIPMEWLRSINGALGRTVVTKYGTKRGAIALGNILPLGIGAAIGFSGNYAMTRAIARQADRFFAHLPPLLDLGVAPG